MATHAMEGLDPLQPTEIKVDFTPNPVVTSTFRVNDYGLVAKVTSGDGYDLYFVPWSRLQYAKQHFTAPVVP